MTTSGDVAIAMSAASAVLEYEPASGSFATIALSGNVEPLSVAYTTGGELVVGAADWSAGGDADKIELVGGNAVQVVTANGTDVATSGNNVLAIGSPTVFELVAQSAPPAATSYAIEGVRAQVGLAAVSTPDGSAVLATTSGFAILSSDFGQMSVDTLPSFDCSNVSLTPDGTQSPSASSVTCQEAPRSFGVDQANTLWFTSNAGTTIQGFTIPT